MRYGVYVRDDGMTSYARLVDADHFTDLNRGWTDAGVANLPLMPQRSSPRIVYGTSATTGRRGTAVIATPTADLWTGIANSFTVEPNFPSGTVDLMTVTFRRGERFRAAH